MRLLPRTPRGTWLLAGAVWLAGCGVLWWAVPLRPRVIWPTDTPGVVHGFIPRSSVLLTSSHWPVDSSGSTGPSLGPLVARDAEIGRFQEWLPKSAWLTLVEPGVDGRHAVIGRVVDSRARLFLHDASNGEVVCELPRGGPRAEKESDLPRDADGQFATFRPDGQRVVYADRVGDEEWLRVWDVETKQEVAALPDAGPPAAWSPDGQSLAYVMRRGQELGVGLWHLHERRTRELGPSPFGNGGQPFGNSRPTRIHFTPDGRSVVRLVQRFWRPLGSLTDYEIVGWDVTSGRPTFRQQMLRPAFPAAASWFATWGRDRSGVAFVERHEYAKGEELDRIVINEKTAELWGRFSPDGGLLLGYDFTGNPVFDFLDRHVLKGALGPSVRPAIWETGSGSQRHVLPMALDADLSSPTRHAWSADGTLLAFATSFEFMVWDIPPRRSLKWFMAAAAVFALGLRWLARRRVRRLRKEAVA